MGLEHSRVATDAATKHPHASSHRSSNIHYTRADVAVWSHLTPLAQWFTAHDAHALHTTLCARTTTSLLAYREFVAWLQNGRAPTALRRPVMPVRHDILAPPPVPVSNLSDVIGKSTTNSCGCDSSDTDPTATVMLELYLEHVFQSLKTGDAAKVSAMELLAALTLVSQALWRVDDKVDVLIELFYDRALSARHTVRCGNRPIRFLKETDVAYLVLCVMRGVARVTVGVGAKWDAHGVVVTSLARQLAATCMNDALEARKNLVVVQQDAAADNVQDDATDIVQHGISEYEFRRFVADQPVVRRFVALFTAEAVGNPFTFAPPSVLSAGVALPSLYDAAVTQQIELYQTLLQTVVTLDGRAALRRQSAAVRIQSTWRRCQSLVVLAQHCADRLEQQHAAASTLQRYVRQQQRARVLERHADIERDAFNGGVYVAGSGPCAARLAATQSGSATSNHPALAAMTATNERLPPLRLIETFKRLQVRVCDVAASQTCALALATDRRTLFAWGQCLPCAYVADSDTVSGSHVRLFQPTPARLAYTFSQDATVQELACGLRHALVRTAGGMVYSWGFNDHGQLGHGNAETLVARTAGKCAYLTYYDERDGSMSAYLAAPTQLVYFEGSAAQRADPIPVAQVVCGDYYSMALSAAGDVFTWGEASEGQLGHGDAHAALEVAFVDVYVLQSAYTFLAQPEPVLALSSDAVAQVACSRNHSVALTRDGRVFEWGGWGKRLGRDTEHAFVPVETMKARELQLRRISVGDHHVLAEGSSVWMTLVEPLLPAVSSDDDTPLSENGTGYMSTVYIASPQQDMTTSEKDEVAPTDAFQVAKSAFYLACAAYSCSFDAIERFFISRSDGDASAAMQWTCTLVDFDVDDLEDANANVDDDSVDGSAGDSVGDWPATPHSQQQSTASATTDGTILSLWRKRVQPYALSVEHVGRFDARIQQLRSLAYGAPHGRYSYDQLLNAWLFGHVDGRVVVFPRGRSAGLYVQFLLPRACVAPAELVQQTEDRGVDGFNAPAVVEFCVCGSSTVAAAVQSGALGSRGFATHAFHPGVDGARLTALERKRRLQTTSVAAEDNSLFILEFDASSLSANTAIGTNVVGTNTGIDTNTVSDSEIDDDDNAVAAHIVRELTARVLAAQEAGVLAVLVVIDLLDVEPFELAFTDDSGVYIPVFMAHRYARATHDYTLESDATVALSPPPAMTLDELLTRMLVASFTDATDNASQNAETQSVSVSKSVSVSQQPSHRVAAPSRFASRPLWTARCFHRVDTLQRRIDCALANGAAGVLVVQDADATDSDGELRGAPVELRRSYTSESWRLGDNESSKPSEPPESSEPYAPAESHQQRRLDDRLVAMISYADGVRLRASSHLSLCASYMPLRSRDGASYELLAHVAFDVRPGGTTYAWGNAENGRLGVAATTETTDGVLRDGYDALTDSAYRFVEYPLAVAALAGHELQQLACGSAHSVALTAHGEVWTWGRGARGALAQSDRRQRCRSASKRTSVQRSEQSNANASVADVWTPQRVDCLRFERIAQVAATDACTLIVSESTPNELFREWRREVAQLKTFA